MAKYDISVVIPCYNSELTIKEAVEKSEKELDSMGLSYEFILINDYSKDNTIKVLSKLASQKNYIKVIDLAKNFGQHNALMAGFSFIDGDLVIGMDDDLQTDPSQFAKLIDKLNEGYDLVYGYYAKKKENIFRRFGSAINNYTLGKMINQPKHLKTSSFWIARAYVIQEAIKYEHSYANLRGLFFRTTAYIGCVEVEHFARKYGKTNYTFKRLLKLWSSCVNFSIIPLRLFTIIGGIASIGGVIGGMSLIIRKLLNYKMALGWPSLMSAILLFSGIILIGIGFVGEYIGRSFLCINATPQYVVRKTINVENDQE